MSFEDEESCDYGAVGKDALLLGVGAIIGAAAALLYAPQSGEKTRRQIGRKIDRAKERATDMSEDILDKLDDARGAVGRQIDGGVEYVGEKKEAFLDSINALQAKLHAMKSQVLGD